MRALTLLICLSALACKKEPAPSGTSPSPSQSTFVAPSAAPAAVVPSGSSKPLGVGLGTMLQSEQSGRPTGTPRAEDVLAAFNKEGIVVEDAKQHLGAPIGAKYCVGGTTKIGVALSICEFDSPAAAEAGKATSQKAFGVIEGREIFLRKATTLTTLQNTPSAATKAEVARAAEAFAKL